VEIEVRASSISGYADCPRRWAAKQLAGVVLAAGFRLRQLHSSAGAVIGSGTHAAVAHDAEHKKEHGEPAPWKDVEDHGIAELEGRIDTEGVEWDDVTPNLGQAHQQVRRLARVYRSEVLSKIKPVAVERRLKARHHTGLIVSGQQDVVISDPMTLRDLKTGKRRSANFGQYGSYSLLLRSHGQPVYGIVEDFIMRVPLDKPQPAAVEVSYSMEACEQQSETVLCAASAALAEFMRSGSRDAFMANPSSALCSDRWCPAAMTGFCPFGKRN